MKVFALLVIGFICYKTGLDKICSCYYNQNFEKYYESWLRECMLNSLAVSHDSTSIPKASPVKLDIKRHSHKNLYLLSMNDKTNRIICSVRSELFSCI